MDFTARLRAVTLKFVGVLSGVTNTFDQTVGTDFGGNNPNGGGRGAAGFFGGNLGKLYDVAQNNWNDISTGLGKLGQYAENYYGFENGKYTGNVGILHAADEFVGAVDGRNQSRAALHLAQDQFNYAQQQAQQLLTQQQWNNQQSDISGSQNAAATTRAAAATSGINYSNATPNSFGSGSLGGTGGDFLGL